MLIREENLTLTKLQEIVNIFDEPDALFLTPSCTREEANAIYIKHSNGFNSPDRTFKGKCCRCAHVGNVAKSDTFRPVTTPGTEAPLFVAILVAVVDSCTEVADEVMESRMLEALRNGTPE